MHRNDKIGQALLITLRDIQIEVGTSEPFYNLDPDNYPYVTPDTRWKYFWTAIHENKMTVRIHQMWTPKPQYEDDSNIMEHAVKDQYMQTTNKYRLVSINRCRLYLRCFYVSGLITPDSPQIGIGFLDGTKRCI